MQKSASVQMHVQASMQMHIRASVKMQTSKHANECTSERVNACMRITALSNLVVNSPHPPKQARRAGKFFTTATQNWCPDKLSVPSEA